MLEASTVYVHHEGLDRGFADKAWACSVAEVDWKTRGFEGTKLGYRIGQSGYFHEGHRAVDDCFALLEILVAGTEGDTPFAELHGSSQRLLARIWAEHSPFDMKDKLKARGYRRVRRQRRPARAKAWWGEVTGDAVEAELSWLQD